MTDLHYLSATSVLRLFAARELSPVELLDALVARAGKVGEGINAFTEQMLDDAYIAARASEQRYRRNGEVVRALEGLPLAIKEEQPIAGRTLEEGSLLLAGHVASTTHPVVSRVLDAGAVIHARTTTPEFSCAPFTHSKLWGVTRNPWSPRFSPGGSSGGAGAALAAGLTTLATGSDIGGSIRIPASFCGVVGFKPPFGRVPGVPPFNQDTYCADGPMARTVADVALLQNVLAGPHPHDQASLRPAYRLPDSLDGVEGMTVGLCIALGDYSVDPSIEANTRAAAEILADAGAKVVEVELPWRREALTRAAMIHFGLIFGALVVAEGHDQWDLLTPYARSFGARSVAAAKEASLPEGLELEGELYPPLGDLFNEIDILMCPTVATQGFVAGEDYVDATVSVGSEEVPWEHALLTLPFNVIGRCPVLSVPSGRAPNGVPTGVQLVGRTYDDVTVFAAGKALEAGQALWDDASWRPAE